MKTTSESKENLIDTENETSTSTAPPNVNQRRQSQATDGITDPEEYILTQIEKKFLLTAERGDCAGVRR